MSFSKSVQYLVYLLLYVALVSPAQWCVVPIGNTALAWTASILIIVLAAKVCPKANVGINAGDYRVVKAYLAWVAICSLRGVFVADNYWEYKQLVNGTLICLLPVFVYVFYSPELTAYFYRKWLKVCVPLYFVFYMWTLTGGGTANFYLAPLFVLGCFLPLMPFRWRVVVGVLLAYMLLVDWGARSQVLKSLVAVVFSILCLYRRSVGDKLIRMAYWGGYFLTLALLVLGVSGVFNLFEDNSNRNEGKYVEKKVVNGQVVEEDVSADTRTFIYEEVLTSALRHGYLIYGRTPARGNDSVAFGLYNAEDLKTGRYERHANELCHLNLLTWLGLAGMLMYTFIYLRSSYLAVYRSNSKYLKFIGLFVAFHWAYGWVEDINRFDIQNIALWSTIAMGLSDRFRAMNDADFKRWFRCIFGKLLRKAVRT